MLILRFYNRNKFNHKNVFSFKQTSFAFLMIKRAIKFYVRFMFNKRIHKNEVKIISFSKIDIEFIKSLL